MRIRILSFITALCALNIGAAHANWQYSGGYLYDSGYGDSGSRASVTLRGGATFAMAKMQNDTGSIVYSYCYDPISGTFVPDDGNCTGMEFAGAGSLDSLGIDKLSAVAFSAGASIGWVLPYTPQWRLELGWDHFSEVDFNESPLFHGDLHLSEGYTISGFNVGTVQSQMSTDVISIMMFYDFFDGMQKPIRTMIPYIGLGFGYADTVTKMRFFDQSGEVSDLTLLAPEFGVVENGVISFYPSTTNTANVAGVAAIGFSYGIDENLFLDFGFRAAYLPRVRYTLANSDDSHHLDWFTAKNLIYANAMLGLRIEF